MPPAGAKGRSAHGLEALMAHWAMQFTPRVAWLDEALLLELAASVRLFGGRRALRARLRAGARTLGGSDGITPSLPLRLAWAPTGLAALALARAGLDNGFARPLPELLDPLPLACLSALRPHEAMLHLIGCRSLGALRRLPREGLARRLDADALRALDQAYGVYAEAYAWLEPPEQFSAQVELTGRVDDVPALMAGAQRLLLSLAGWLAARHLGVCALTLRWHYDSMRARSIAPTEALTLRTATPTRDAHHLARLLAEHLARVVLRAPVATLGLQADEVQPLTGRSTVLWPGQAQQEESLQQVLERLSARLGPERVLRGQWCEDYRPEHMQCWEPAAASVSVSPAVGLAAPLGLGTKARARQRAQPRVQPKGAAPSMSWPAGPQPSLLLPEPLPLVMVGHRPHYQGPLRLLLGPQRVEGGWWEPPSSVRQAVPPPAQGPSQGPAPPRAAGAAVPPLSAGLASRDYWVAESERAGVLWVFQTRLEPGLDAWYLHGFFA